MNKLVGRSTEIATIGEALSGLTTGHGSTLLMAGEPGIGKSTLARHAANLAAEQSMTVCWGFCWEAGGAPAYWPWTQSLRALLAKHEVPQALLTNLGQLLPETGIDTGQPSLQPDQARFLLLESVRQLLDAVSRKGPFVIILEDLHAADTDSLHLLQYVARHIATMPVLLIGTYRELEARHSPAMEPLWRTARDSRVLKPDRLDEHGIREYLAAQENTLSSDEQVERLLATTEGNPLFLTELVELMSRSGDAPGPLPETVQQVIDQQISLLPDSVANVLRQASVLGREFGADALAALRGQDEAGIEAEMEPALKLGLLKVIRPGHYRFSHALHRDVLYQGLGTTSRQELHLACAQHVRKIIDAGDEDRWSTYATHLQAAGSDHRNDATAAWEKSAQRAYARVAFDEAARALQNALNAFGDGPKFDPARRCALQLQCAEALLLAGNIEAGQTHCREGFATARTLENPSLMSEAALTYGNALVVARIDKELIGMLRECLDILPPDDAATRSQVQARLAAAMQPARIPSEPMQMAREAIKLARSTGDERVLFHVLRSAISALMDFAPTSERIPLNREFEVLAARRGSVAGQFRSNLRLMFDAIETGDRQMLDDAVDAAENIANRIGLPHYQWRVASARAMQNMIEGNYARATELINEAQALADRIDDLEAKITLPAQRFVILCDWDSEEPTPLQEIDTQLQYAYANGMAAAEFFIRPFVIAFTDVDRSVVAEQLLGNPAIVERSFGGGDRFSVSMFGEVAAATGDTAIADRAYDTLADFADGCSTLGLMGGCWYGPIAYSQGIIARGLGRTDAARTHFEKAIDIATQMRSPPMVARAHVALAEIAAEQGEQEAAAKYRELAEPVFQALGLRKIQRAPSGVHAAPTGETAQGFSMQLDGDIRVVTFRGESTSLKDSKGLALLDRLVSRPGKEMHVLDLAGSTPEAAVGDSGPALDDKARDEYKRRVEDLQDALTEAELLGDTGRVDALRGELDFITRELSRAYGLGGRERRSGSAAERARVNVRRRLKDAIQRIGEQIPDAGIYLENTIKTGSYCKYVPM